MVKTSLNLNASSFYYVTALSPFCVRIVFITRDSLYLELMH